MPLSPWISRQLNELADNRSGFHELCERVPVGIFLADLADYCVYANPAACAIVGLTPGEAIDRGWTRYLHPDDAERTFAAWEAAVAKQSDFLVECRYVLPERGLVWTRSHATPWRNAAGEVAGYLGSIQDITDERRAEEALRQQERLFRTIFEQAGIGVGVVDSRTGRFVRVNQKYCDLVGYTAEEMTQRTFQSITHPDDLPHNAGTLAEMQAGRLHTFSLEKRYIRKDGQIVWVNLTITPLWKPGEPPDHHITIVEEITQRKLAEHALEALRASEEQYRELFNATTDAVAFCSLDGRLVDVNPAACRMHGYTREEFLQLDVHDFIHPDSHPLFSEYLETCRRGELFHCEAQNIRRDGTTFDIEVHGSRLIYRGEPHAFAIVRDISERKAAEAELRRQEAMLAHVSRLSTMGEMVAGIAHEVNQPLYSIVNFAKASGNLLEGGEAPDLDELRNWNEEIAAAATRAGDIVRRLRDFTRRSPASQQPNDLNSIVCESLELVRHELGRAAVDAELLLADELPAVLVDRVQIQQVVVNLLKNAMEALACQPPVDRRLEIATRQDKQQVLVEVSDNGPGLATLAAGSPFDPFVTSKSDGMGLGLAISRTIVEAHGGTIIARNNQQGGATFIFSLPMGNPPA